MNAAARQRIEGALLQIAECRDIHEGASERYAALDEMYCVAMRAVQLWDGQRRQARSRLSKLDTMASQLAYQAATWEHLECPADATRVRRLGWDYEEWTDFIFRAFAAEGLKLRRVEVPSLNT